MPAKKNIKTLPKPLMPQGALKSIKPKKKTHEKKGVMRKGLREFKASTAATKKAAMIRKHHTSALTSQTEKSIAAKVGHLELLKGTRKQIENENKNKTKKK